MRYEIRGSGEPLVLLHGFGGCIGQWEPFLPQLTPHFRVILLDLRGHGASTNPTGTFTHRQAAADVLALLDRLGVDRFRAIGMSTGAMTLLHIAARQPERLEAMVLVSGTTHFTGEVRAAAGQVASALATGGPPELRGIYGRCATRGDLQVDALLEQFVVMGGSRDDMDFDAADLASIPVATLIVHGDRDEFFPVDIPVGMYRSMPDASLWIVPDANHVALFGPEGPRIIEGAVRFLGETAASAAGGPRR